MQNNYEVYIGMLDGEIVYVGEGVIGRHKHLNSGVSNVYSANRIHFNCGYIDVEVVHSGLNKQEATELEKQLIYEFKPTWNKRQRQYYRTLKVAYTKVQEEYDVKDNLLHGLVKVVLDLCDKDGYVNIGASEFKVYSGGFYISKWYGRMQDPQKVKGAMGKIVESVDTYVVKGQTFYKMKVSENFLANPKQVLEKVLVVKNKRNNK